MVDYLTSTFINTLFPACPPPVYVFSHFIKILLCISLIKYKYTLNFLHSLYILTARGTATSKTLSKEAAGLQKF